MNRVGSGIGAYSIFLRKGCKHEINKPANKKASLKKNQSNTIENPHEQVKNIIHFTN